MGQFSRAFLVCNLVVGACGHLVSAQQSLSKTQLQNAKAKNAKSQTRSAQAKPQARRQTTVSSRSKSQSVRPSTARAATRPNLTPLPAKLIPPALGPLTDAERIRQLSGRILVYDYMGQPTLLRSHGALAISEHLWITPLPAVQEGLVQTNLRFFLQSKRNPLVEVRLLDFSLSNQVAILYSPQINPVVMQLSDLGDESSLATNLPSKWTQAINDGELAAEASPNPEMRWSTMVLHPLEILLRPETRKLGGVWLSPGGKIVGLDIGPRRIPKTTANMLAYLPADEIRNYLYRLPSFTLRLPSPRQSREAWAREMELWQQQLTQDILQSSAYIPGYTKHWRLPRLPSGMICEQDTNTTHSNCHLDLPLDFGSLGPLLRLQISLQESASVSEIAQFEEQAQRVQTLLNSTANCRQRRVVLLNSDSQVQTCVAYRNDLPNAPSATLVRGAILESHNPLYFEILASGFNADQALKLTQSVLKQLEVRNDVRP